MIINEAAEFNLLLIIIIWPYTMFFNTNFASKTGCLLIWKELSITMLLLIFLFDFLYSLLSLPQFSAIRILAQFNTSLFLLIPNYCFQISIYDNLLKPFHIVFFEVWNTMILSQVCDSDVILSNLWLQHPINLKNIPNLLLCHIFLIWNLPAAECTMLTLNVIHQIFFPVNF